MANLDQFEQMTAHSEWIAPQPGERVHVDNTDGNRVEGRVTSWDMTQLTVRVTPTLVVRPRWGDVARVVFLDRPRG